MSIFATFYLLFKSNTVELKKGEEDINKSEKAFDKVGKSAKKASEHIKKGREETKKSQDSFKKLTEEIIQLGVAFLSFHTILEGIKSASEYAEQLYLVSKELGVSTEALDAWGNAVAKNGGTVQGFQQTLRGLNDSMMEIAATGSSSLLPMFTRLGIHVRDSNGHVKSALDILPQLADSFQRLGTVRSRVFGKQLGLDLGTILLLQQGRKAVEEAIQKQKELGLVTAKDAEISHQFNEEWKDLAHSMRSIFMVVNSSLLPALTELMKKTEKITAYLLKHADLIKGAFIGLGIVIAGYLIPALIGAIGPIGLAITGIISLFALVYEDIQVFQRGGISLIGKLIAKWDHFKEKIIEIGNIFKYVGDYITDKWHSILNIINRVINAIITAREKLRSFLGLNKFGHHSIDVKNSQKKPTSIYQLPVLNYENLPIDNAQTALHEMSNTPLMLQSSNLNNKVSHQSNTINTGPITIQTQATDANGIASEFGDSLEKQMRQALNNFATGVLA